MATKIQPKNQSEGWRSNASRSSCSSAEEARKIRIGLWDVARCPSFAQPGTQLTRDAVQELQHVHVFIAAWAFHFQAVVLLTPEQVPLCENSGTDAVQQSLQLQGTRLSTLSRSPWNDSFKASRSAAMTLRRALCSGPRARSSISLPFANNSTSTAVLSRSNSTAGNPGHRRVADNRMQPDRQATDDTFGQKVITITQHQIFGHPSQQAPV